MDTPNEIVMEILSRLPIRDVNKCRVLSKSLAKITHESFFKSLHAQRHEQTLDGFLLQSIRYNHYDISYVPAQDHSNFEFSLSFLPGTNPQIRAVAPNGLMLCVTQHPKRNFVPVYCICKPTTRQWMQLPIPKTRYFTRGTGMAVLRSDPLHFKIVRFSEDQMPSKQLRLEGRRLVCELFDSETWMWKRFDDALLRTSQLVEFWHAGVWASGSVHWKISDNTIFAFHFDKENWSIIAMPDPIRSDPSAGSSSIRLAEYEGKLAAMRTVGGDHEAAHSVEVWVMEHYRKKTWTKSFAVPTPDLPMAFYSSDIGVEWHGSRLVFDRFDNGGCSKIRTTPPKPHSHILKIFPFWSDFEPNTFAVPPLPPPCRFSVRTMAKITDADVYFL